MKPIRLLAAACCLCIVFACKNSNDQKNYLPESTDSTSNSGLSADTVKLVKTADINFKVKNVEQGIRAVSAIAQKYGGMLTYQNMDATEDRRTELKISTDSLLVVSAVSPRSNITARIPSQNIESFLFDVADLGYYTGSSRLQIDDKSLAYLENASKEKNRTTTLAAPPLNKAKAMSTAETIAIKDEAIEKQLANKAIDADVAYSTITLSLFQNPVVRKEVVANTYIDSYRLPFSQRMGNALTDGWEAFLSLLIALAHLWVFVLVSLVGLIVYRQRWQKRKQLV